MRPYKRPADYLFSTYKLTSKMRPGGAFFFSEARDALCILGAALSVPQFVTFYSHVILLRLDLPS